MQAAAARHPAATRRGPDIDLAEFAVDIYTVATAGVVEDQLGQHTPLSEGEKIKLLDGAQLESHNGCDWIYAVVTVQVRVGGTTVALKPGTRIAVLAPDYREQLKAHATH